MGDTRTRGDGSLYFYLHENFIQKVSNSPVTTCHPTSVFAGFAGESRVTRGVTHHNEGDGNA